MFSFIIGLFQTNVEYVSAKRDMYVMQTIRGVIFDFL